METQFSALRAWIECLAESSRESYESRLCAWFRFLNQRFDESLNARCTPPDCYRYLAALKARGLAEGTRLNHFMLLRRAYRTMVECDTLEKNPWNAVRLRWTHATMRPQELISNDDVRRILKQPKGAHAVRDRTLIALLFGGALRIHEACDLNVSDVERKNGIWCIWLKRTKTGETGWHSLPAWAGDIVAQACRQGAIEGVDMPVLRGWKNKRLTTHHARVIFNKACEGATGKRYRPHSARATAITNLLSAGVPIDQVQIFSRHRKIVSVQSYDLRRVRIEDNPGLKLKY